MIFATPLNAMAQKKASSSDSGSDKKSKTKIGHDAEKEKSKVADEMKLFWGKILKTHWRSPANTGKAKLQKGQMSEEEAHKELERLCDVAAKLEAGEMPTIESEDDLSKLFLLKTLEGHYCSRPGNSKARKPAYHLSTEDTINNEDWRKRHRTKDGGIRFPMIRVGGDRHVVDIDTYNYAQTIMGAFSCFAVVSENANELPMTGYIIPFSGKDWKAYTKMEGPPASSAISPDGCIAIRFRVIGGRDVENGYASNSRAEFTWGFIAKEAVEKWTSWRFIGVSWLAELYDKFGFNLKNPDVSHNLTKVRHVQNDFGEMFELLGDNTRRQRLLLTIAVLFNYWETAKSKNDKRALHLENLKFIYDLSPRHIGNYYAEAGCVEMTRSQAVAWLDKMRKQASRYFQKNPSERIIFRGLGAKAALDWLASRDQETRR